jgi:hypothetical protein
MYVHMYVLYCTVLYIHTYILTYLLSRFGRLGALLLSVAVVVGPASQLFFGVVKPAGIEADAARKFSFPPTGNHSTSSRLILRYIQGGPFLAQSQFVDKKRHPRRGAWREFIPSGNPLWNRRFVWARGQRPNIVDESSSSCCWL